MNQQDKYSSSTVNSKNTVVLSLLHQLCSKSWTLSQELVRIAIATRCGTEMILQSPSLFLILKIKNNKNMSVITIDTVQRKLQIRKMTISGCDMHATMSQLEFRRDFNRMLHRLNFPIPWPHSVLLYLPTYPRWHVLPPST